MAITYTWAVTGMKVTNVGSETNYVVQTYWTKTGTDENATPAPSAAPRLSRLPRISRTSCRLINSLRPSCWGGFSRWLRAVMKSTSTSRSRSKLRLKSTL